MKLTLADLDAIEMAAEKVRLAPKHVVETEAERRLKALYLAHTPELVKALRAALEVMGTTQNLQVWCESYVNLSRYRGADLRPEAADQVRNALATSRDALRAFEAEYGHLLRPAKVAGESTKGKGDAATE